MLTDTELLKRIRLCERRRKRLENKIAYYNQKRLWYGLTNRQEEIAARVDQKFNANDIRLNNLYVIEDQRGGQDALEHRMEAAE